MMNDIVDVDLSVSDALTYFARIANDETAPQERREFAGKAGDWVIEASEKLGGYVNKEARARRNRERYALAKGAVHSKSPSPVFLIKRHSVEYDKLLESVKEEMNETAKLAAEVKSLYDKEDGLMMELAGIEFISDEAGGAIGDRHHVAQVLRHIGTINYALMNGAQIAFGADVSRHMANGYAEAAFVNSAKDYATMLNEATMASAATFAATAEVLAGGKRVTKKEFSELREKYGRDLSAKIGSVVSQMEEALMKNASTPEEQSEYKGPMFA